jgi:hypothetical protein
MTLVLICALIGVFAGLLGGALGLGGGVVIVPPLIYLFHAMGFDGAVVAQMAVGTSLATIIVTAGSSVRAHHVAGFVRDDADQFRGRLDGGDEPRMKEHLLSVRDEGVEPVVVDEMQLHRLGVDARGPQDGIGIFPQHRFGLGVADDRDALRARGRGDGHEEQRTGQRRAEPPRA